MGRCTMILAPDRSGDARPDGARRDEEPASTASFDRPIFIFGCGRSGTSLLSRILNRHPRIAIPFESHVLNTFMPLLERYGDLGDIRNLEQLVTDILSTYYFRHWQPPPDRNAILAAVRRPVFADVFDAIHTTWARAQGKARWGEKSPQHVEYWQVLRGMYPRAQVVHIVRDGRDVALSLLGARFGPKTAFMAAHYWRDYLLQVESVKREIDAADLFELTYEDLVRDPDTQVAALCSFLDEPYSETLLRYYETEERYPTDARNERNLLKPILSDNTGKWKDALSRSEVAAFEAVAGDMLTKYRYERHFPSARLSAARAWYLRWIQSPPRRLVAMAKNRRGYVETWILLRIRGRLWLRHLRPGFRRAA